MSFWLAQIGWNAICVAGLAISFFVVVNRSVRQAFILAVLQKLAPLIVLDYIIVGDSLAEQCDWAGALSSRRCAVLNLATGGATIKEIAGQIMRAKPVRSKYLLIDGGLGDVIFYSASIEQIEHDFKALLRRAGDGARTIVTLLPYVSDAALADRIDEANESIRRLAKENGCAVIDLNPEISSQGARRPEMTNDGLHFTPLADSIWIEAVRRKIGELNV
jgi:lysophospholipase L1-like esterase